MEAFEGEGEGKRCQVTDSVAKELFRGERERMSVTYYTRRPSFSISEREKEREK